MVWKSRSNGNALRSMNNPRPTMHTIYRTLFLCLWMLPMASVYAEHPLPTTPSKPTHVGEIHRISPKLDALIAPVVPGPFPANANLGDPGALPNGGAAMRFTGPFNLSGSPSLTMCGGFDSDGAPIGFQLVGPRLAEERLLMLGAAFQDATEHHLRRPSLS